MSEDLSLARGRAPAILATLLSLFLAYLIVRAAMATIGGPAAVMLATLPPRDYRETVGQLNAMVQNPQVKIDRSAIDLARRAALAAPLIYQPYVIMAKAEYQRGRLDRAILLAQEARRRRPSDAATRGLLVGYYAEAKRYSELMAEIDMVLRLSPELRGPLLPELAKLLREAPLRRMLIPVLATEPEWRDQFYAVALSRGLPPRWALEILKGVRDLKGNAKVAAERRLYLHSLLAAGYHARARELWTDSLAPADRAKNGLVFDPNFRGSSAPDPYNWRFTDSSAGRAELASTPSQRPGLNITYFGSQEVDLAEQKLALPAGSYSLTVNARSDTGTGSSQLAWVIVCDGEKSPVTTLLLGELDAGVRRYSKPFVVPSRCGGQRLFLRATPGDRSSNVEAQVRSVEIRSNA